MNTAEETGGVTGSVPTQNVTTIALATAACQDAAALLAAYEFGPWVPERAERELKRHPARTPARRHTGNEWGAQYSSRRS